MSLLLFNQLFNPDRDLIASVKAQAATRVREVSYLVIMDVSIQTFNHHITEVAESGSVRTVEDVVVDDLAQAFDCSGDSVVAV